MNEMRFYIYVVLTLLVTFAAVMISVSLNNSHLDDFKDLLRAEIARSRAELLAKLTGMDRRLGRVEKC